MQVVRLTVEILRPVPIAELGVACKVVHAGRKLRVVEATMRDAGEKVLLRARALALRVANVPLPDQPVQAPPPGPRESQAFDLPFFARETNYHQAMEMRVARGQWGKGPMAAWMRMRMPLVAGETPSPLQRVMTAADSGSGVGVALDMRRHTFVNPDLTVYLHRLPKGEWVCLDAVPITEHSGIGLADTRLYDEHGAIGRGLQSLVIQEREA